jgi:cyanide dihydratase
VICESEEERKMMEPGHGFTRIIAPNGCTISKLASDEEGICYADIDLTSAIPVKCFIDTSGHYSTLGTMQLYVDMSEHRSVHLEHMHGQKALSYDELQSASE